MGALLFPPSVGYMLAWFKGSFTVPLISAGAMAILGAMIFLFLMGRVERLPLLVPRHSAAASAGTHV